ncbi:hypothetical protein EYC84_004316 [Monilinia fructicola]|uniref:Uncharacterized protein n=1 Tax=Monilinia fructicola TaxID=38448 RepID=A0A5M9K2T5_MONFR|nr:hypothetical protein EYC84_004316 [Monilinia fructicola]
MTPQLLRRRRNMHPDLLTNLQVLQPREQFSLRIPGDILPPLPAPPLPTIPRLLLTPLRLSPRVPPRPLRCQPDPQFMRNPQPPRDVLSASADEHPATAPAARPPAALRSCPDSWR